MSAFKFEVLFLALFLALAGSCVSKETLKDCAAQVGKGLIVPVTEVAVNCGKDTDCLQRQGERLGQQAAIQLYFCAEKAQATDSGAGNDRE